MNDDNTMLILENIKNISNEWTPRIEEFLNQDNKNKTKLQISIRLILIKTFADKAINSLSDNEDIRNLNNIIEDTISKYTNAITVFKKYIAGELIEQQNFMKLKASMKSKKGYLPNEIIKLYKSRRTTVSDKRIYTEKYSLPIELKI